MTEPKDWTDWKAERRRFTGRDTEGFTKDMAALEAHIKALTEVIPKDKAGFPDLTALFLIQTLTRDYNSFKDFLNLNR